MSDEHIALHGTRPWLGKGDGEPKWAPQKASYCKPEVAAVCLNCTKDHCSGTACPAYTEVTSNASGRGKPVVVKAIEPPKHNTNEKLYTANGSTHTLNEWVAITGVSRHTIRWRLKHGMPFEDAIRNTDLRKNNRVIKKAVNTVNAEAKVTQPASNPAVEHPAHYNAGPLEVIDVIEGLGMGKDFNRGNAIKYIARAGLKSNDTEIQDLQKAEWYIHREIERLRKEQSDGQKG